MDTLPFLESMLRAGYNNASLAHTTLLLQAGHKVNHKYGFGKLDVGKMVVLAANWSLVSEQLVFRSPIRRSATVCVCVCVCVHMCLYVCMGI